MFATVMQTMRIPFLILTPVCILLGVAVSASQLFFSIDILVALLGAMAAHISVNMLNEYQDFSSGLDLVTERTPFSGGSGGLPAQPEAAHPVLWGAMGTLFLTIACGTYLALQHPTLWPLGGAGSLLVLTYTRYLNRSPWLCLIAPGTGFGLLMVTGTTVVAGGGDTISIASAVLVVFLLVNNLLLLNQFPDIAADAAHGRNHFLICYGVSAGIRAYGISTFAVAAVIVLTVMTGVWSQWVLLALIPWAATLRTITLLNQLRENIAQRPEALGLNVLATLLTPLVAAIALLLA
ncbi:MAG: prenyltransferase [Thalassolituus sp.]